MVHTRSLERGSGGILKQLRVVASVDDQAVDPLCVAELCTTQENLVWLDWLQLLCWFHMDVTGELVESFVGSLTLHMPLGYHGKNQFLIKQQYIVLQNLNIWRRYLV